MCPDCLVFAGTLQAFLEQYPEANKLAEERLSSKIESGGDHHVM